MLSTFSRFVRWSLLAVATLVGWSTLGEPQMLLVRHDAVEVEGWTGAPLRLALISDLHVGSPFADVDKVGRVADAVAAEQPDAVLLLGDYAINRIAGGHKVPPSAWAPRIGAIPAPLGVYAVLGNHDWWNDEDAYRKAFRAAGVRMMDNASVAVRKGEDRAWLVGLGDTWTEHTDVDRAFAGVPAGASVVAFSHEPDVIDVVGRRADVVVAGHTHGGQVRIPWLSQRLLHLRFVRGLYRVRGVPLYVTSGVGMSVYPIRLGVPPEVVILEVHGPTAASREPAG